MDTYRLVVVNKDGRVMESTFGGYHAETQSDKVFWSERDKGPLFAATFYPDNTLRQHHQRES